MISLVYPALGVAAIAEWVYTWPYGEKNACRCKESVYESGCGFSTEEECLKSFADSPVEYCVYGDQGISSRECTYVVSIQEWIENIQCQADCQDLIFQNIDIDSFLNRCAFEPVIDFDGVAIAPLTRGCFTNMVLGWEDFDPEAVYTKPRAPPFKILSDVDTPVACQELCQASNDCAWFAWKGIQLPDYEGYQNEANSCLLYDANFLTGWNSVAALSTESSEYCDTATYKLQGCGLNSDFWDPLNDNCLLCGCEARCAWQNPSFISGPAYCSSNGGITDLCSLQTPHSTSSTTTAVPTLPPTQPVFTTGGEETMPEGTTGEVTQTYTTVPETTTNLETETTTAISLGTSTTGTTTITGTTTFTSTLQPPTQQECKQNCIWNDDCHDIDAYWEAEDLE